MPRKDYISSEDWADLQRDGKLKPIPVQKINCYFCKNTRVTKTATDARGTQMPKCTQCGIYYQPQWILQDGQLAISIMPRTHHNEQTQPNEIPQYTQQPSEQQPEQPSEQRQTQPQQTRAPEQKAPERKDVRGQIIALMEQRQTPIKTADILKNINASRQSIMTQINQLIAHGKIRKIQRATYQIIPQQNHN